MTNDTAAITPAVEPHTRWRDWQTRSAASDRRTAARMRTAMLLTVGGLIFWFVVQLT